jgi:CTP synthase (UTP-ammonia lyase)
MYGRTSVVEPYFCKYGLNPEFEPRLQVAGLRITGRDADGAARAAELDEHPFFVATLYVFQARDSTTAGPHPITRAFLAALAATRCSRTPGEWSPPEAP